MYFYVFIEVIGGLALFLYGIDRVSSALQRLAGARLRPIISRYINNRISGVTVGTFVTFLLQSSSASTVLFVSMVEGGLLRFADTIALSLGAMIGTTLTVQIIAFRVTDYALLAVALGVVLRILSQRVVLRQWAHIILGVGLLFFGMDVMQTGVMPLRDSPQFMTWFTTTIDTPWLSFLLAVAFTSIVQASAATIAIVFSFVAGGLMGTQPAEIVSASLPFVFGANVGTTITALLATIHTRRESVRVAVAYSLIKLVSAIAFMFLIQPLTHLTLWLTNHMHVGIVTPERYIANSHTLFNVLSVCVILPFTSTIARLCEKIVPSRRYAAMFPDLSVVPDNVEDDTALQRLHESLATMCAMLQNAVSILENSANNPTLSNAEKLRRYDAHIDDAYHEIRNYAVLLQRLSPTEAHERAGVIGIHCAELLERIGDDLLRNGAHIIEKMCAKGVSLNVEATASLRRIIRRIAELLSHTAHVLREGDSASATLVRQQIKSVKNEIRAVRDACYDTIGYGVPRAVESSEHLSDILAECESSLTKMKRLARISVRIT